MSEESKGKNRSRTICDAWASRGAAVLRPYTTGVVRPTQYESLMVKELQ